jgi:hypothetical protein
MKRTQFIASTLAIVVCAGAAALAPIGGGDFDLSWHTIDGGGYTLIGGVVESEISSSGGGYELSGTVIRPDPEAATSGSMTANDYSLTGEFHVQAAPTSPLPCPGDVLDPPGVGVEDLLALMDSLATTDSSADLDNDGTVGVSDLLALLANWGPCP